MVVVWFLSFENYVFIFELGLKLELYFFFVNAPVNECFCFVRVNGGCFFWSTLRCAHKFPGLLQAAIIATKTNGVTFQSKCVFTMCPLGGNVEVNRPR